MLCALSLYFHPDVMERRERENEIIRKAKESDKEARKAARAKTKWVWQQDPNNPGRNIHVEVPNVPEDISNWPKAPLWLPRNESGMTAEEVSDFNGIERNRGDRNFIRI